MNSIFQRFCMRNVGKLILFCKSLYLNDSLARACIEHESHHAGNLIVSIFTSQKLNDTKSQLIKLLHSWMPKRPSAIHKVHSLKTYSFEYPFKFLFLPIISFNEILRIYFFDWSPSSIIPAEKNCYRNIKIELQTEKNVRSNRKVI